MSLFLHFSPSHAHVPQDGDIYALAGPALIYPLAIGNAFHLAPQGAFNLSAEGDIDDHGGVELAMFYMPYYSSIQRDGMVVTEKVQRIHISTGYRYWFTSYFSLQLGFFSAYAMGGPTQTHNDFGLNAAPSTSAADSVEYGFDGSFQVEPLRSGRFSLILDVRYAYSVTPKPQEHENFVATTLAIKYFLQSREESLKNL